jgi:hypothetical protein
MKISSFFAWTAALLPLSLLPSCGHPTRTAKPIPVPLRIEAGFDPTPYKSDVQPRDARLRMAALTLPEIAQGGDSFVLRATDNKTTIIATAVPESEDAASAMLEDIINTTVPVTDLCTYFETLASAYEHTKTKIVFVVYTDGKDDGKPRKAAVRISRAAARLAANPNVLGVILAGLIRDTRNGWTGLPEMLAPLDEKVKRIHVIPQAGMTPERILEEVEAVRASAAHR